MNDTLDELTGAAAVVEAAAEELDDDCAETRYPESTPELVFGPTMLLFM